MRVYHRPRAGRPVRALWALEEAGIAYELEVVSGEGESAERHRARHPLGRVPVLEDDEGRTLFESSAICLYAAELAPADRELIPAPGTLERALTYQWIFFVMTEIEPPAVTARRSRAGGDGEDESALKRVARGLAAVEAAMADRDYILGQSFSIADVVVSEVTRMTERLEVGEPGPNLTAYFERVGDRPGRVRAMAAIAAANPD